ncbi:hypothetical protein ACCO45_012736 [Purpureocillium lilacinum]|uniref:Uncharacterized protein n=1 Tax=Purpureocillium lilacinum TaxID=33203 RepID=A0ACC4DBX8_PURLI
MDGFAIASSWTSNASCLKPAIFRIIGKTAAGQERDGVGTYEYDEHAQPCLEIMTGGHFPTTGALSGLTHIRQASARAPVANASLDALASALSTINLSIDGWRAHTRREYIAVCGHFVDGQGHPRTLLGFPRRYGGHTGDPSHSWPAATVLMMRNMAGLREVALLVPEAEMANPSMTSGVKCGHWSGAESIPRG